MRPLTRLYGASPGHLIAVLAGGAVSAYAVSRVPTLEVLTAIGLWFAAMLLVHDLVLFPLYAAADNIVAFFRWLWRGSPLVEWVNHVRFPVVWSGLLLLAWFPIIFRLPPTFEQSTARSADPFLWHWLVVTALLFAGSLLAYLIRRRVRQKKSLIVSARNQSAGPARAS